MLRLKFFLTAAALLLVAGCVVPMGGSYAGYGGYDYYGDYPTYPSYVSYEYPFPVPYYGYPGEYTGDDAVVAYPPEPVAFNPPIDYQTPVYPPGTDATVSDPQPPYWRWQAHRQTHYHRRHHYRNHQEGPYSIPPETNPSVISGTDPPNRTVARPHRRHRLWGDHRANRQRFQSLRREGPQRVQRAHPQSFPFGQRPHMANQQRRMRTPLGRSTMSAPMAKSNPTPSMRVPRFRGNTARQASAPTPHSQSRKHRQKRRSPGSQ
jgi:hypothetical protein